MRIALEGANHRTNVVHQRSDDLVKSRHPVEKRGPGAYKCLKRLDSGSRRNNAINAFSIFCETIKICIPYFFTAAKTLFSDHMVRVFM